MIKLHHDGVSRPIANPKLRVLSLGAGVQSTTIALMAARGEIPAPDCAIFADTGDEGWRGLRENPDEWRETVELDGWLREPAQVARFRGEVFLHASRVPLAAADLTAKTDEADLFGQECEGMCGV